MVGSGTGAEEFPPLSPSLSLLRSAGLGGPPAITTGDMKGVGSEGDNVGAVGPPPVTTGGIKGAGSQGGGIDAGGPSPITTGGKTGVRSDGGSAGAGGPPPIVTGGVKGVGSDGGVGVSKTSGVGSSGDVFPGGASDNTLAHRVLVKFVPSVINLSPFATFNLFFVQKISSPIRYET